MRRLFTLEEARARGPTKAALQWGSHTGRWRLVERGVYVVGTGDPAGTLAGVLLELDSVVLQGSFVTVPPTGNGRRAGVRRFALPPERIIVVKRIRCTDGLQTLLDLAPVLNDVSWEHALESALRKKLTTIAEIEAALTRPRLPGAARARRVLVLRPPNAPPTESLLETLMVQLARAIPGLRPPDRQVVVTDANGAFIAHVDLAWPELGLFIELDGEHHLGQPVYDASRETAVVAATGWLCGRFASTEVVRLWHHTVRRLTALVEQARRRPLPA